MTHLVLLYFFLAFLSCILSLGFGYVIFLKTQSISVKNYLILLLTMGAITLSFVISTYDDVIRAFSDNTIYDVRAIFQSLSFNTLKWSLPLFIHSFFKIPFEKKANRFFAVLSILFNIYFVFAYFRLDKYIFHYKLETSYYYISYAGGTIFILLYSVLIGIYYKQKITSPLKKNIYRKITIFLAVMIPLLILDNYTAFHWKYFIFAPFLIIIWNIYSLYLAMKYYFWPSDKNQIEPLPSFWSDYKISPREKEVCLLILKKQTTKQMATQLFISEATIKTHRNNIYRKIGIKSKEELEEIVKLKYFSQDH